MSCGCGCGSRNTCGPRRRSIAPLAGGGLLSESVAIASAEDFPEDVIALTTLPVARTFTNLTLTNGVSFDGTVVATLFRTPVGGSEVTVATATLPADPDDAASVTATFTQLFAAGDQYRVGLTETGFSGTTTLSVAIGVS